jgi:hypothetical protein
MESTGKSMIVTDGAMTIRDFEIGVDWLRWCDEWGYEPELPVTGWSEMSDAQRRLEMAKRELQQMFRGSWEDTFASLDAKGWRFEATGEGGRVVLEDGSRIKLSEIGRPLAHYKGAKAGDFPGLLADHSARALSRAWVYYQSSKLDATERGAPDPQATAALKMRAQGMSRATIEECLARDGLDLSTLRKLSRWLHGPRGDVALCEGLETGVLAVARDNKGNAVVPAKRLPPPAANIIVLFRQNALASGGILEIIPDVEARAKGTQEKVKAKLLEQDAQNQDEPTVTAMSM